MSKFSAYMRGDSGGVANNKCVSIIFTTTSTSTLFSWDENTLKINRGAKNYIPINIYNENNEAIAASFRLDDTYIYYDADVRFSGTIFCSSIG